MAVDEVLSLVVDVVEPTAATFGSWDSSLAPVPFPFPLALVDVFAPLLFLDLCENLCHLSHHQIHSCHSPQSTMQKSVVEHHDVGNLVFGDPTPSSGSNAWIGQPKLHVEICNYCGHDDSRPLNPRNDRVSLPLAAATGVLAGVVLVKSVSKALRSAHPPG